MMAPWEHSQSWKRTPAQAKQPVLLEHFRSPPRFVPNSECVLLCILRVRGTRAGPAGSSRQTLASELSLKATLPRVPGGRAERLGQAEPPHGPWGKPRLSVTVSLVLWFLPVSGPLFRIPTFPSV